MLKSHLTVTGNGSLIKTMAQIGMCKPTKINVQVFVIDQLVKPNQLNRDGLKSGMEQNVQKEKKKSVESIGA